MAVGRIGPEYLDGLFARGCGPRMHRERGRRRARLAGHAAFDRTPRIAVIERGPIVPPLFERCHQRGDCRASDLELGVVPRRNRPVARVQGDGLGVAEMTVVVVTTVAQIDPTDETDRTVHGIAPQDDDKLLVMASASADALVQQDLCTFLVEFPCERCVVGFREVCAPRMRPPDQSAYDDTSAQGFEEEIVEPPTAEEFVAM